MEIQKTCYAPSFSAKFASNKFVQEGILYASNNKCLRTLENSLHNLSKADDGIITTIAGKTKDGHMFCNMMCGKKTVSIPVDDAQSIGELVYNGMVEIGMLGKRFRTLFNVKEPKCNIDVKDIFKNYIV